MMTFLKWVYIISLNLLAIEIILACYDVTSKVRNDIERMYLGIDYEKIVREYGEDKLAETIQGYVETIGLIVLPIVNTIFAIITFTNWQGFRDRLYDKSLDKTISRIEKALKTKKKVDAEIEKQLSDTLDRGVNNTNYIHSELYQRFPENFG